MLCLGHLGDCSLAFERIRNIINDKGKIRLDFQQFMRNITKFVNQESYESQRIAATKLQGCPTIFPKVKSKDTSLSKR